MPELTIERVREDIRGSSEDEIPENLDELADRPIDIFYLEGYALAHVDNKMGASQGHFQQSYILAYQIIGEQLKKKSVFLTTITFNY